MCRYYRSGFYYKDRSSNASYSYICIKCASISHSFAYQADKSHYIFIVEHIEGKCNACCKDLWDDYGVYRCKDCTFCLDGRCLTIPRTARHKRDQHSLSLAYQDPDDYPLRHYCDICEERRDSWKWYYHCESCDNALHIKCVIGKYVIGKYSFIRVGSKYTYQDHPHPLTFVRKMHYYPECNDCGEPCQDLALECEEHGCKYIVHWTCILYGGADSGCETSCYIGSDTGSSTPLVVTATLVLIAAATLVAIVAVVLIVAATLVGILAVILLVALTLVVATTLVPVANDVLNHSTRELGVGKRSGFLGLRITFCVISSGLVSRIVFLFWFRCNIWLFGS
ncbi:hypothetical protein F3Y22_tig00111941pilonHSYRG00081 [Hibiscus syriacus]|uniref:DC1 domain-containing protein n=1 Tax=Hibiscus syriacus TaxID=106335 RepID=A0A6A2X8U2_HIBSY|nr:hypothetical protein F3Y22_tig00111941pilonHSYRG00081 [Hibiscus syriacus]